MERRSFLYDLNALGIFDSETYGSFRHEGPGLRAKEIIEAFEALAERFPPEEIETAGRVPDAALEEMGKLGLFGMTVPSEYGGFDLTFSEYLKVVERMAPVDLSLALVSLAHLSIGVQGLVLFGSEEQKRTYLPRASSGELVFAYALTEPKVGSDAKHIETRARPEGDAYVLNGQKTYITNANYAGAYTVFAQIEGHRPGHMGAFVVERDTEGLTVGKDMPKMGLKASSTAALRFEDVRVPADNLIGQPGEGFRIAMSVLNYGRLAVCAAGVGLMERSVADMAGRANSRVQFGQPIARFPLVQEKIASAAVNAYVSASMVEFAARQLDRDPTANVANETSHCKLFATGRAWEVLYDALQVAGGSGYLSVNPYEKRMRDFRVATIFEGTTEIHSMYPALFLLRGIGDSLPRSVWARLWSLAAGALRSTRWPGTTQDPVTRQALRIARSCNRRVRWLLHTALLVFGKGVSVREFLLRRITWLSVYQYGILASAARIENARQDGLKVGEEEEFLRAFALEAADARAKLTRLRESRREKLLTEIARSTCADR